MMGGPDPNRMPEGAVALYKYKPPVADPDFQEFFYNMPGRPTRTVFRGVGRAIHMLQGNFCKVLQIKPGAEVVTQDIALEPATALPVMIQDGDGRPLTGTWVTGIGSDALDARWTKNL
jgi:hypothetical protein